MYLKTENLTEFSKNSQEILRRIYGIIVAAGAKGVEYRRIIKLLRLKKKEEKKKYENYLLSHYCRKLVNYGCIVVKTKTLSYNSTNVKIAFDSRFIQELDTPTFGEISFLKKRKSSSELTDFNDVRRS